MSPCGTMGQWDTSDIAKVCGEYKPMQAKPINTDYHTEIPIFQPIFLQQNENSQHIKVLAKVIVSGDC